MILFLSRFIELSFLIVISIALSKSWKTNIFSLGTHGFLLIGAYSIAFFSNYFLNNLNIKNSIFNAILFTILLVIISGLISMFVSKIFIRIFNKLNDDYFAIATLAFAEILLIGISSFNFLGGAKGIEIKANFVDFSINENKLFFAIFSLTLLSVFVYLSLKSEKKIENIFLKSISENQNGIDHLGVNTKNIKENIFSFTGFWTGIVGALMALYYKFISPNDFTFITTIPILLFVVLGRYSVKKTLLMTVIIYLITETVKSNFFGLIDSNIGNVLVDFQDMLYGIILMISVFVIYGFKKYIYA